MVDAVRISPIYCSLLVGFGAEAEKCKPGYTAKPPKDVLCFQDGSGLLAWRSKSWANLHDFSLKTVSVDLTSELLLCEVCCFHCGLPFLRLVRFECERLGLESSCPPLSL